MTNGGQGLILFVLVIITVCIPTSMILSLSYQAEVVSTYNTTITVQSFPNFATVMDTHGQIYSVAESIRGRFKLDKTYTVAVQKQRYGGLWINTCEDC